MIRETNQAFKDAVKKITDGSAKAPRVVWGYPSEWHTDPVPNASRTPVADLTQTQVSVVLLDFIEDPDRSKVPANIGTRMLSNKSPIKRVQRYPEPVKLMYQVNIRTEGNDAVNRVISAASNLNNILRDKSYLPVMTDIFGIGEKKLISCFVELQSRDFTPPEEIGRDKFERIYTYLVSSWILDREQLVDVPLVRQITIDIEVPGTTEIVVIE